MHTSPTRPALVACMVILGLTMASCSSAALVRSAPPETAADERPTTLGGEMDQILETIPTAPDPHESPEVLRVRGPVNDPVSVVTAALMAWSEGDRQAFDERLADSAHWFGLPLDGELGRRQFEFKWGYNTTLGARFSDIECIDSGRKDSNSEGPVVVCSGMFSDTRYEALGVNPAPFDAEYAVDGGQIGNAISFRAPPDKEAAAALDFVDAYLTELGNDYGQACDPAAGSSGKACAEFILSHLPTVVEAWNDEPVS